MPSPIADKDILDALANTGFPLEHRVTEAFRAAKWGVVSGRYYIDDQDGGARELDLLAYRIRSIGSLDVVSTVLVSCKKEGENTWAFMSRAAPAVDANHDWCPVHWWTDEEPLATYLRTERAKWKPDFEKSAHKKQAVFHKPIRDIFAYQVIAPPGKQQPTKKPNAKPNPVRPASSQNNVPIFGAVSGLLKALHHELTSLPRRMAKRKRVYVFHLAVIADAPMVDVQHDGKTPKVKQVDSILHLARFIVARESMAALVSFSTASDLPKLVTSFDVLSEFDASTIKVLVPKSYAAIEDNDEIRKYFTKLLQPSIVAEANKALRAAGRKARASTISMRFTKKNMLVIEFDLSAEEVERFNDPDGKAMEAVAKALKEKANYTGPFEFDWELPF
jgi:hypothetical protein